MSTPVPKRVPQVVTNERGPSAVLERRGREARQSQCQTGAPKGLSQVDESLRLWGGRGSLTNGKRLPKRARVVPEEKGEGECLLGLGT